MNEDLNQSPPSGVCVCRLSASYAHETWCLEITPHLCYDPPLMVKRLGIRKGNIRPDRTTVNITVCVWTRVTNTRE